MLGILFWVSSKSGVRFSTSQRKASLYFFSAWTSRYKQNYFLLFPEPLWRQREEDPMVSPLFKQYRGTHLRISNSSLRGMFRKLAQSLGSLYEVLRKLPRRGQHWLKSKCRYGEINSVRRLQGKVNNLHKLKIFRSFVCQSVTHGLPDTRSPNTKWQKKPPFEDWAFKEVKTQIHWNYTNKSVPALPQTHCDIIIIETNRLMLFREIIPIYCEHYTNLMSTLCVKDAKHYID
jgi:hypothetical protein